MLVYRIFYYEFNDHNTTSKRNKTKKKSNILSKIRDTIDYEDKNKIAASKLLYMFK